MQPLETPEKELRKEYPSLKNAQRYPQNLSNLSEEGKKAQIYVTILSEIHAFMTVGFQDNDKLQMSRKELLDFLNRDEIKKAISDVTEDILSWINEDSEYQMEIYGDLYREYIFDNSIIGPEMLQIETTRDPLDPEADDTSFTEYDLVY